MKAVVYSQYGPPDVLSVAELPTPEPAAGEVRIRVHAAEVTKADCELRGFKFAVQWFWLPLRIAMGITRPRRPVLGGYFAGVIDALGEGVTRFHVGDRVFGASAVRFGAHAEYVCLPSTYTIVPMPENLSFAEAAAVPLGALNALHFMRKANIQAGDKVLINGAGGSIGLFAVQIAKNLGAEVSAVDSGIKEDLLRRIGVDHFFDYTQTDFTRSDQTYDVIFNMVAGSSFARNVGALTPSGRYLTGNPRIADMLLSAGTNWFSGRSSTFAFAGESDAELTTLKEMLERGELRAVVDQVFAPEQAAEAHQRVETEQRLGSIVLDLTQFSA